MIDENERYNRMIDTAKYGNITPERWAVDEEDPCRVMDVQGCTIARTDFVDIDEEREWQLANAQLIADVPLILEDYKRLREELNQTRECLWWCYDLERFGNEIKDEHWDFIGRLLGADTDHNDNEWSEEE